MSSFSSCWECYDQASCTTIVPLQKYSVNVSPRTIHGNVIDFVYHFLCVHVSSWLTPAFLATVLVSNLYW